ncbi:hypothetical protein FRB95_007670 [Tulasnella sp. JGI-2019a]|nr:hypothetical protein FRB95_007670 [Tulasnella sp. JGI-2019a]
MHSSLIDTKSTSTTGSYSLSSAKGVVDETGTFYTHNQDHPSFPVASPSSLPPAYASNTNASTSSTKKSSSIDWGTTMRVNILHIHEKHQPIIGAWIVDPGMHVPLGLLTDVKLKKRMDNLNLYSRHKQIRAQLTLASESPTKSFLTMETHHGPITVDIGTRTNQRFHLSATSKHGSVTVYLPRDFEGPISFRYKKIPPQFSEELQPRMTLIGRDNTQGIAFVGDLSKFGNGCKDKIGRYEHWNGDELVVATKHRAAMICYSDEPREEGMLLKS